MSQGRRKMRKQKIKKKEKNSPLWRNELEHHGGVPVNNAPGYEKRIIIAI